LLNKAELQAASGLMGCPDGHGMAWIAMMAVRTEAV